MNDLAHKLEDDYILRLESERKRAEEQKRLSSMHQAEQQRLRDLHYMRCPKCGMELREFNYKNIRIDKCFSCQGSWLDAGEIEAIAKLEKGALGKLFLIFQS